MLLSVPLVLEYEAACRDPEQRVASGLGDEDVRHVVSALCASTVGTSATLRDDSGLPSCRPSRH